jgi:arginase
VEVAILSVPYHLDRHGDGTGSGPARLLEAGVAVTLTDAGHTVRAAESVTLERSAGNETGNIFELARGLAAAVRDARASGAMPLVLAGDCNNVIGVVSGCSEGVDDLGIVWLDAHGDAHTPETSGSGFFDGMPLAAVLGWCWSALAKSVPGFEALEPGDVVHLGGRAFDENEREPMEASGIAVFDASAMRADGGQARVAEALERLAARKQRIHVHLDLDVIDRADGVASGHAVDGGPSLELIEAALATLGATGRISSATICSYDPSFDTDGRAAAAGIRLLGALATHWTQGLTPASPRPA